MRVIQLEAEERWRVVFKDRDRWQVGVYVPENISSEEVLILERHDCPELFLLIEGRVVLVLSEDGLNIKEVEMEPGKLYIVEEWHNAYRPGGGKGVVLVVEAPGVQTEYISLEPGCRVVY